MPTHTQMDGNVEKPEEIEVSLTVIPEPSLWDDVGPFDVGQTRYLVTVWQDHILLFGRTEYPCVSF